MNKLKKILTVFLAATVLLTSAGCADDGGADKADTSGNSAAVSQEAAQTDSANGGDNAEVSVSVSQTESTQKPPEESAPPEVNGSDSAEVSVSVSQTESTQKPPEESASPEESGGITASYTVASTWEESGMTCSQLDFTVKNGTDSNVSGWTVDVDLKKNFEIMQSWNVNASADGTRLKASNVEYNGELAAGAETTFGCIVKASAAVSGGSAPASGSADTSAAQQTTSASSAAASQPVEKPEISIESSGAQGLVSQHGQLSVKGADLVDKNGEKVQLRGVSTHGIQWFPQFANKEAFRCLRDEWGINTIRLAMYSGASEGYTDSTKADIEKTVQNAADACIELDMYVIIDWHVLADQSPQVRKADALRFFGYMSERYADYPNVIYEICNEPNGYASWQGDIKPYAEEVIPVIRANDPDSVIIVGTPTWSQDIDKALSDPLKFDNVMYALHYYAATHTDWLRDRLKNCYNSGLPVFVSEFGNCDASGGGSNDFNQAKQWLELIESLNISYMTWALSDKNETCSLLTPGAPSGGGWTDSQLSENGRFMRDWFSQH